ncbi:hypothetical protein C5B89_08705 [Haloferax sp. Atlit-47N]|uniref:Uncharacterized protein n=2 Tax=Haloferax TaxID=2251 RepID=A0ACD5HUB3_9EURY|nr:MULTISPECIES: hypothetical protein [Haloferax]ELZ76106.1 lipoprotein [Haloferax lucentense DSM 14919]MBC9987165.1 hypothetical protein [Haloferax sp. AS1]RDZ31506.1 hypothetical protein DEQ67_08960 [Haloferax sp. Atlit-48N]RDZ38639.1 hypothetical protein C5B89_08705 [Haloferax sp. Atlit-47N]WEL26412.1 hypothetical protein SVXHx_2122 [Haloferax lucentense]
MSLRSALGSALGYALLGLACLFVVFAGYWAAVSALTGATAGRAMFVVFGLGAAVTTGFFGYFVRKAVAGQVMPSEFDVSVAYRGGR